MSVDRSGSLRDRSVASLLEELAAESFTGLINVTGSADRLLALDDGQIYLALSSNGPTLPRALVAFGVVDEATWQQVMQRATGDIQVIDALLDHDADRELLDGALRSLCVGTILELLVPTDDDFTIAPGERHRLGSTVSFPVAELLREAGERLERWGRWREVLPSMTTLLHRNRMLPPGRRTIELDRIQWQILDALDRPRSLADLIGAVGLGAFALFDELYGLLQSGAVLPGDANGDATGDTAGHVPRDVPPER